METRNDSMQLAGGTLGRHRHVCAFFNSIDEEHRVLRSFFKDGLDRGEKATHVVDPEKREEHLKRLGEAGINVQQAMAAGRLEVLRSRPWPLADWRCCRGPTHMSATTGSTRMLCWRMSKN